MPGKYAWPNNLHEAYFGVACKGYNKSQSVQVNVKENACQCWDQSAICEDQDPSCAVMNAKAKCNATVSVSDNDYWNTFMASGCNRNDPDLNIIKIWKTWEPQRVFADMAGYASLAVKNTLSADQKRMCCGYDKTCSIPSSTLQTKFALRPPGNYSI